MVHRIHFAFLVTFCVLAYFADAHASSAFLTTCVLLTAVECTIHLSAVARSSPGVPVAWLRPDTCLMPGYLIVHFGAVCYALSGVEPKHWHALAATPINFATASAAAGLAAFLFGFSAISPVVAPAEVRADWKSWERAGLLLCLAGTPLFAWTALNNRELFFEGSYGRGVTVGLGASTTMWAARMLLTAGATLIVAGRALNREKRIVTIPLAVVAVAFLGVQLIYGARSVLVYHAGPPLVAYFTLVNRPRFKVMAAGAAFSLLAFGVLQEARQAQQRGFAAIFDASGDASIEQLDLAARTFSGSGMVYLTAVRLADDYGFYYGKLAVCGLFDFVPFAKTFMGIRQDEWMSSHILTRAILGQGSQVGTGTTIAADLYLDGGIVAVVFGMGLFGALCRRIQQQAIASRGSAFWVVAHCCLTAGCLVVSRYSIALLLIRHVVYVAAIAHFSLRIFKQPAKAVGSAPQLASYRGSYGS